MQREIGSEFHSIEVIDKCDNNIFSYLQDYNTIFFDSGRSALKYLLQCLPSKRVLLPGYICESVRSCFGNSEVQYYRVDTGLRICWDDLIQKIQQNVDLVYFHFFNGYIDKYYDFEQIRSLQKLYGFIIIEDTTHSFLTNKNIIGDYCICSLRKWFPIPDGGILYSKRSFNQNIVMKENQWYLQKYEAMIEKTRYLFGDITNKDSFLSVYNRCEKELDMQTDLHCISAISMNILKGINLKDISRIRRKNMICLENMLPRMIKRVSLGGLDQVPLFFTVMLPNRDSVKKFLINHRIYCPVHWPLYEELENIDDAKIINGEELSIPIDQRYNESDMEYIANVLLSSEVDI